MEEKDLKEKIKEMRNKGYTYRYIGELLGFSHQYVHDVFTGRYEERQKHKTY